MSPAAGQHRRAVQAAWCLYDAANSAFATTILAVLFNSYFARVLAGGMEGTDVLGVRIPGPTLYSFLLSGSLVLAAGLAPAVGLRADRSPRPVLYLFTLAAPSMAATALLGLVGTTGLTAAMVLFPVAVIGFSLSSVVYDGLLPRIADPPSMGRVSGWGWGLGFFGGGLLLLLCLGLIRGIDLPGGSRLQVSVPATFPVTALWWAVLTLPLLAAGRWIGRPLGSPPRGVGGLLGTARRSPHLLRFLAANLLYGDGVQTVVAMASIFAATLLGWPSDRILLYFLAVQGAALVGSALLGYGADRWSERRVLFGCLAVWLVIALATWRLGWTGRPDSEYWLLGILGGLVLGPTQSLSRSLLGKATPPGSATSVFSLFAVSNRFAAVLGPLTYGFIAWWTGSLKAAALSTAAFFALGGLLLAGVDVRRLEAELRRMGGGT